MAVAGTHRIKELFRAAAGLTIDTNDVKRYHGFVDDKLYDLLLMAVVSARANRRDIIQPSDLPLSVGLQDRIREFEQLAQEMPVEPILQQLATHPPLDAALRQDVEDRLPAIVGGLSVALAKCFAVIDPHRKNPGSDEWSQALRVWTKLHRGVLTRFNRSMQHRLVGATVDAR